MAKPIITKYSTNGIHGIEYWIEHQRGSVVWWAYVPGFVQPVPQWASSLKEAKKLAIEAISRFIIETNSELRNSVDIDKAVEIEVLKQGYLDRGVDIPWELDL